jgi:deoxycytidylate deaminase
MKIQDFKELCSGLKKAYEASLQADHPHYHLGCAIMFQGKQISIGANDKTRSHPYVHYHGEHFNHGIHAEMAAIFRVKKKDSLKGATIYIYRQTKNGTFANARPCSMCFELIRSLGIKKMVYTVENGIKEEKVR